MYYLKRGCNIRKLIDFYLFLSGFFISYFHSQLFTTYIFPTPKKTPNQIQAKTQHINEKPDNKTNLSNLSNTHTANKLNLDIFTFHQVMKIHIRLCHVIGFTCYIIIMIFL